MDRASEPNSGMTYAKTITPQEFSRQIKKNKKSQ